MDASSPASPPPPPAPTTSSEDKLVAILSYITLFGFIVAIILNMSKKTKLGAYHLRQMLGFVLTGIVLYPCTIVLLFIPILGWILIFAIWVGLLVFWVMGLVAAINGQLKPMPFVGPLYQKWFGAAFD